MDVFSDVWQYTQMAADVARNMSVRSVHRALAGFVSIALPAVASLSDSYQAETLLQQAQAVLPLPFSSRQYNSPWHLSIKTTTFSSIDSGTSEIQVFDSRAHQLLDSNSHVLLLVENTDDYAFAHEAPVYFPDSDTVYFCSDAGGKLGRSNSTTNNVVFHLPSLNKTITRARQGKSTFEEDVQNVDIGSDYVQMTNGATPYQNQLLLINSGRTSAYPPSLTLIDRFNSSKVQVLLNNANGKQFNALNDVKVNFHTGAIYFTDASYGQSQHFRPNVDLPKATWRFDPRTGRLTMLDASVITPNGLALSKDGRTMYITETASNPGGDLDLEPSVPSVIYAFDVIYKHNTEYLQNRRLFAHVPTGVADGIQVDIFDNVYSCTGDGLYVWDSNGLLMLRAFLSEGGCVSLYFAGQGRIIVTAETRLYLLQLAPHVRGPALETYPRPDRRITVTF